jgi:type IV secretory pathway TraG/TraD family ATPase VirD4
MSFLILFGAVCLGWLAGASGTAKRRRAQLWQHAYDQFAQHWKRLILLTVGAFVVTAIPAEAQFSALTRAWRLPPFGLVSRETVFAVGYCGIAFLEALAIWIYVWWRWPSAAGGSPVERGTQIYRADDPVKHWAINAKELEAPQITNVRFCGYGISADAERTHFGIVGMTGSGKTVAIKHLLESIALRARSSAERVVFVDSDYTYKNIFFSSQRGDVILNPLDESSGHHWNPFAECVGAADYVMLANCLVPMAGHGDNAYFYQTARGFVADALRAGKQHGCSTGAELHKIVAKLSDAELLDFLGEDDMHGNAALIQRGDKTWASVRSTAATALAPLMYSGSQGDAWSAREWLAANSSSWLFLSYRAGEVEILKTYVSAVMARLIKGVMGLGEKDHQLWFIADELDAIGVIDELPNALVRVRKFGGRCVLGFQTVGKIKDLYGQGAASQLAENVGNYLFLRMGGQDHGGTATWAAEIIGRRDVWRTSYTQGSTQGNSSGGQTIIGSSHSGQSSGSSTQISRDELTVTPTELGQLPNLTGYVRVADWSGWARVQLQYWM